MTQTLLQIRTQVRSRLDEPTAVYWTDADLNDFINESQREVARRALCCEKVATFNAVANQNTYPFASHNLADIIQINRMEFVPTGSTLNYPLEYRDWNSLDEVWWLNQSITAGIPHFWTSWGVVPNLTFQLYPKPSTTGVFNLFYWNYPADLVNDGDVCGIPNGWHDLLVTYACYVGFLRDRDPRATVYFQKFDADVGLLERMSNRHYIGSGTFVGTSPANLPTWLTGGGDW